jgi:O-antigen/teichoic acid export membrane protein
MAGIAAKPRRRRVIGRDLQIIGSTVWTEAFARLLSLVFYLAAGRLLLPADFGVLRYTLALGGWLFLLGNVLGRATARELGATDTDREAFQRTVTAALLLAAPMLALALGLAAGLVLGEITPTANLLGLATMLVGRTAFEVYYAVARGGRMLGRMAATYVGFSALQVVLLLGYAALSDDVDSTTALVIFGVSMLLPIAICELRRPVLLGHLRFPVAEARRKILYTGRPLLLSTCFFLMWATLDQLVVETVLPPVDVGYYGAAKTLAHMFSVLPFALNAALVPRIAQLRTRGEAAHARRLLRLTLIASVSVTAAGAGVVALLGPTIMALLFGEEFRPAGTALGILGVGYVAYMAVGVISSVAVGWGRRALNTAVTGVAGLLQLVLLVVVDYSDSADVATINAVSMWVALVVAVAWITIRPLGGPSDRHSQDRQSEGPVGP